MKWNVEKVAFLHRPDVFEGSFGNAKMQERHEKELRQKLEALHNALKAESDPFLAMKILHPNDHAQFFDNNQLVFHDSCRFEEAVLFLYRKENNTFYSSGDFKMWGELFGKCEKKRLLSLGEPLDFEKITVYRGSVMGVRKGLCWTPDRKLAEKFAKRWGDPSLSGGELYEVDVTKDDILVILKTRGGVEMLLDHVFISNAEIRDFNEG